jgi:Bacterial Ig domain
MRFWRCGLAIGTAALLQACAQQPPPPAARVFAADMAGAAKACSVPATKPVAGQETQVPMKVANDGGWCAITVNDGGKPYSAGLLVAAPAHGKVFVHTVGNDTRIDYTPAPHFAGPDAFTVRLIPGDATIRVAATVTP